MKNLVKGSLGREIEQRSAFDSSSYLVWAFKMRIFVLLQEIHSDLNSIFILLRLQHGVQKNVLVVLIKTAI